MSEPRASEIALPEKRNRTMTLAEKRSKHVVLITGTSAGFGRACAEHLSKGGYTV